MNSYQPSQQLTDLRWGTMMPIMVMVNTTLAQLRARGKYSASVVDPARLAAEVSDTNSLSLHISSMIALTLTDMLGNLSATVSDAGQLTTVTTQTVENFHAALEPKFKAIGLQLMSVRIDAIESL